MSGRPFIRIVDDDMKNATVKYVAYKSETGECTVYRDESTGPTTYDRLFVCSAPTKEIAILLMELLVNREEFDAQIEQASNYVPWGSRTQDT